MMVRRLPGSSGSSYFAWWLLTSALLAWCAAADPCFAANPPWNAPPGQRTAGQFWRLHWYERGLTNGNPAYDSRFRVNSPEVVLHPSLAGASKLAKTVSC